jgi:DNA-binding MarR family transcriptional regulator
LPDLVTEDPPPRAQLLRRALDRTELAVVRHRSEVSRRLGVSDEEMLVLLHVGEHGGLTQSRLASLIGLSRSGMGAMIQRLERAQLIERHPDPADKRVRLIKLSARSVDRITSAYQPLSADVDGLLAEFSPEQQDAIARFLTSLAEVSESHARRYLQAPEPVPAGASRPLWRLWG